MQMKAYNALPVYRPAYQYVPLLTEACSRASERGAHLQLWLSYSDLADLHEKIGNTLESEGNRSKARQIVGQIAESLLEVGLRDMFLNQPRVKELMH
jgi:hypothetical protein